MRNCILHRPTAYVILQHRRLEPN